MMIDLTALKCRNAVAHLIDRGGVLSPTLNGVDQRVNRVGARFAVEMFAPPESMEPDGRLWVALLQMAKRQGCIIEYPQVEFDVGACGNPVTGAVSGGTTLPITGGTPNYAVRQGQALSITRAGRSYLYFAAAQSVLNASGAGSIALTTMLRTQMAGGEPINLRAPVIEGFIEADLSIGLDENRTTSIAIMVKERA